MVPGVPVPARVTVRPDRSFHFEIRTPNTAFLLLKAAGVQETKGKLKGANNPGKDSVGEISLKHVYEIAKIKQLELRLSGLSLEGLCKTVIAQAKTVGVRSILRCGHKSRNLEEVWKEVEKVFGFSPPRMYNFCLL